MNIRVDLNAPIKDGTEVVFRTPVDCSQVTGLILYYNGCSQEFAFADAHGNNVGDIDHLFAENVVVKVILDLDTNMAFVQNADTNAYLEGRFDEVSVDDTCVSKKPWSSENIVDKFGMVASASGGFLCLDDCFPISAPIKGLKAYVMATQQGEGTPSAENVRPIVPFEMSAVTVGVDRTEDMPNPTLYSSGTLDESWCYGGYVDWARGVFVQTHAYIELGEQLPKAYIRKNANTAGSYYVGGIIKSKYESQTSTGALQSTGMCNSMSYGSNQSGHTVYCSTTNVWFKGFTECETIEEFHTYITEHPVQVVYPLATPIEHTLVGNDEIWLTEAPCYITSDGSNLEVSYVADTKKYFDKKLNELAVAIIANA